LTPRLFFEKDNAMRCLLLSLLFLILITDPARAALSDADLRACNATFRNIGAGEGDAAATSARHSRDPLLRKILETAVMAMEDTPYSYEAISRFLTQNKNWPMRKRLLANAETTMPSGLAHEEMLRWFRANPPETLNGFYHYIEALGTAGLMNEAPALIHKQWIEGDFTPDEISAFRYRFQNYLRAEDDFARLDRLLWTRQTGAVRALYRVIPEAWQNLAEARIAFYSEDPRALTKLQAVPASLQRDAGLLYEQVRHYRKARNNDAALEILANAPENLRRPDLWWDERNILARRLLEEGNASLAYRLLTQHGLRDGTDFLAAEFFAGWLALRFLGDAATARVHFELLLSRAATPISLARGYYWLARSFEALQNPLEAQKNDEAAATRNLTFYGQMAMTKLSAAPILRVPKEPMIPDTVRQKFTAHEFVRAADMMQECGMKDRARSFLKVLADEATERATFALLIEKAQRYGRNDLVVEMTKAAHQKNHMIAAEGYPILETSPPFPPEKALTHAIIRQESTFKEDVVSPAGAIGLMQLMPSTAKSVAKKLDLPYRAGKLSEPAYNIRLGTHYLQTRIDDFDGSYILAAAAYNAGIGRVREWLEEFGDPRTGKIDVIDWMESIPIYETRNYVQRVLEALQIYRARIAGGEAPLKIADDLRR
jgi:soluble lytic murein transglycosylase